MRIIFESDPNWYPGKNAENAQKRGAKVKFTPQKRRAIAKAAMALKRTGAEPTAAAVLARCPAAGTNPATGQAFDLKLIRDVFRTKCYDLDPSCPWGRHQPLSKTAMPGWLEKQRQAWAKDVLALEHTSGWYYRHCIWMDPCSTIVPASPRAVFDHTQANKGKGPRWMSKDAQTYSRNLRAAPYGGKQASWGDLRVWWFVVLTRGKVRLPVLGEEWTQNGEGMARMVAKLPALLDSVVAGEAKPRVIFTDRGPGFYQGSQGTIVLKYKGALAKHGFRSFAGEDAKWQPPDIADSLPHETVAAWVRKYFRSHPVKWIADQPKNRANFVASLKECEKHINRKYNVKSLCHCFPRHGLRSHI